jgi:hypothetical protein
MLVMHSCCCKAALKLVLPTTLHALRFINYHIQAMCKYLHTELKCAFNACTMQTAAEQGHSAIVAGLHEQGYELIPIGIASAAALSNSVSILQYLIATGAVFTAEELTNFVRPSW